MRIETLAFSVPSPIRHRLSWGAFLKRRGFLAWALPLLILAGRVSGATITNPSFELNNFTLGQGTVSENAPVTITGWAASPPTHIGLNPVNGIDHFADNGKIPQGTRVAFIRSQGGTTSTLSTTITGLVVGAHYKVTFRTNRKTGANTVFAACRISDGPWVPLSNVPAVDPAAVHSSAYGTFTTYFVARAPSALMEIYNKTAADTALLVDDFKIQTATPIQVTSLNNDGPGSLRVAIRAAAITPAFNVITFAPALSGQTIDWAFHMIVNDLTGLAIDASTLAKGLVLRSSTGAPIFEFQGGAHLRGLTFTGVVSQGAIYNKAAQPLLLSRCTFTGNTSVPSGFGGAITNLSPGNLVLSQCTVSGNTSSAHGGGIYMESGTATLEHCTVSANIRLGGGGGGIYSNTGVLILRNSIVWGNFPSDQFADIYSISALIVYEGANVVERIANGGPPPSGTPPNPASPALETLADNGGPTRTIALQPGGSARNTALLSNITTDQRGRGVLNGADIGAYEVQRGTFSLFPGGSVSETAPIDPTVTIVRKDGFEGAATVNFTTAVGTASALDFTPITNAPITFPDALTINQTLAQQSVDITPDGLVEFNEVINVRLSSPTNGALLGSPAATTITIIDASSQPPATNDPANPGSVVIATPALGAVVNWNGSITVTGTASDNKGVDQVLVRFTGDGGAPGPFQQAVLESPDAASTKWSYTFTTLSSYTNLVIEAKAVDLVGKESQAPLSSRSIKLLHPLTVILNGDGAVAPAGYAPVSYRELGLSQTLIAVPSTGWLFANWSVSGATLADIGVTSPNLQRTTLHFYHRPGLKVSPIFVPSPYAGNTLPGSYKGLVSGGFLTLPTEGLVDITVGSNGFFSAKLMLDGSVVNFAGAFDGTGRARFGTARATEVFVSRPGKPGLKVTFFFSLLDPNSPISADIRMLDYRNVATANVGGLAYRRATTVPPALLGPGGVAAVYNFIVRPQITPPPGFVESYYPQGTGFGRLTLSPTGAVTITDFSLADGTSGLTASAFLDKMGIVSLYLPLYTGGGYFSGLLSFNATPEADIEGVNFRWGRPFIATSQHYPYGWPEILQPRVHGAKYSVVPLQSVMRKENGTPLPAPIWYGHIVLTFAKGRITAPIFRRLNLSAADIVTKVPANDPTYTLAIDRTTGIYRGTFLHEDGNVIPFQGIIYQKPIFAGGHGFFLTAKPIPIDYSGESGSASFYAP